MKGFLPSSSAYSLVGGGALVPDRLVERRRVAGPGLAVLGRAPDRRRVRVAAAPERPAALLVGLRGEQALLDLPVLAVEVEALALEGLVPDRDLLVEAAEQMLLRDAVLHPVAGVEAARDRRVEAALREVVDDGELLGALHRVVERPDVREAAERHLFGLAGEHREDLLGPGEVALGAAVPVRNLERVEARLLGDDPLLDHRLHRVVSVLRRGHRLVVAALVQVDQVADPHCSSASLKPRAAGWRPNPFSIKRLAVRGKFRRLRAAPRAARVRRGW